MKRISKEIFENKFMPEPNSGCWLWTASITPNGYGKIGIWAGGKKTFIAHRVSWTLYKGHIPKNICVLHKCDNRLCVNPNHLFLGNKKDNTRDMIKKGRSRLNRLGRGVVNMKYNKPKGGK